MEEAASMKLKHSILGLLLLFTLIPLGIFGIFSIYETNRKIDELTEQNVRAISENQVMNIKNFTQDRNNEMDMIASYQSNFPVFFRKKRRNRDTSGKFCTSEQRCASFYRESPGICTDRFSVSGLGKGQLYDPE